VLTTMVISSQQKNQACGRAVSLVGSEVKADAYLSVCLDVDLSDASSPHD
jgi:hypothetical protein